MDKRVLDNYNSPDGAVSYTKKFKKHWTERINNRREQNMVRKLLGEIPNGDRYDLALDMPCGYGRLYPLLKQTARHVVEGDWSFYLLKEARNYLAQNGQIESPLGFVRGTALSMPFLDGSFDVVLSVRLCHHISSQDERLEYVRELLRISRNWVVFTYFDTRSVKNILREVQRRFVNKRAKWTLSREQVSKLADDAGFEVIRSIPLSRLFSGHRYTVLRRVATHD